LSITVNKDTFIHLLQQPSHVSFSESDALEEIVKTYPYCQLAHFLIARAHQQQQSAQVSEKLKRAAVYAVNRNVLKKLLFARVGPIDTEISSPPETPYAAYTLETVPVESLSEPVLPIETASIPLVEQEPAYPFIHTDQDKTSEDKGEVRQDEFSTHTTRRIDKTLQNEIIDNFIKKEPRISSLHRSAKDIPQTSQDLSEKSITLPSGIISENLAGIMLKQGKTDKAIEIYEKLILKYPQKKAYFASKIEELKKT